MRPELLKLQAFGPYVKQQCINFHVFDEQHLFLIQGETGSGKTMLLDAMTYALYGKSSGSQREDLFSMRSRFADAEDATIVDFQFQLHHRTYRFVRTITMRRKRNQELAPLMQLDAGEVVNGEFIPFFENPKLKNVEEKAVELLGLSYAQFVQVMVLPQGKFEQLLTSKSEEKQEILKTLFQMERWTGINQVLSDTMKRKKEQLDIKKQRREALLSGIEMQSLEEISAWLQNAEIQRHTLEQEVREKHHKLEEIKRSAAQQQQRKEQLALLQETQKQWETLLQQEESMKELAVFLKRQNELTKVLPQWNALQQSLGIWKQRSEHHVAARQQLELLEKQREHIPLWQQRLKEYQDEEQRLSQKLHECEELIPSLSRLEQLCAQEQQAALKTADRQKQVERKQRQLEDLRKRKEQLAQTMEGTRTELEQLHTVEQEFAVWKQAYYHEQQNAALQVKLHQEAEQEQQLNHKIEALAQQINPLQQVYEEAMRSYLSSSAAQLASLLKEHEPCPVCGSTTHPALAEAHAAYQDAQHVQKLQEELDQKQAAQQKIRQQLDHVQLSKQLLQASLQEHTEAVQELLKKPFSSAEYEEIVRKQSSCAACTQTLKKLTKQQQLSEQQLQLQESELQSLQTAQQEGHTSLLLLRQELEALQESIPQPLRKSNRLLAYIEELKTAYAEIGDKRRQQEEHLHQLELHLTQQRRDVEHAQKEEQQAESRLQEARAVWEGVKQSGIQDAEMQSLKQNDLIEQEQQQRAYELKKEQVKTRLQDLQQRCDAVKQLDLDALLKQQEELAQSEEQLRVRLADITSHETMYSQIQTAILQIQKELDREEPAFVELAHFVRAMRGDNGMGIERYVLGIMLSSITQQANQLLQLVHNGRYQIFRSDEASGRTRKYGLELSIYDSYTCSTRSVVSLSSGEKFLVSLALSLALSSVVQARNGGIQLDTMFIDEGFGTLDEHSIADALAVLQIMSSSRGYVGIISHVELLKENIPAGILVEKSREGSSIQIRKV